MRRVWVQGEFGEYRWIMSPLIDFEEFFDSMEFARSMQVIITFSDQIPGAACVTEELFQKGWKRIGQAAIAPTGVTAKDIPEGSTIELFLFKTPSLCCFDEIATVGFSRSFESREEGDVTQASRSKIEKVCPDGYLYDSDGLLFFVTKHDDMLQKALLL